MSTAPEHRKFVCTDAKNNNNKVWEYEIDASGALIVRWGRVGNTLQEETKTTFSRSRDVEAKVREKLKKGYREIKVVGGTGAVDTNPVQTATKDFIKEAARAQLARNSADLVHLVERLVEANKHELFQASGGQLNLDLKTGIVSTPIGVVTKDNVIEARRILNTVLSSHVLKKDLDAKPYIENLNSYLMLIPQKVASRRGWHLDFLTDKADLVQQSTLLDQLEASADLAASRVKDALTGDKNGNGGLATHVLFDATLDLVTDRKIIEMVEKKFRESINSNHESRNLRPIRVYEVHLPKIRSSFQGDGAKLSNIWMLWHGTRMFNVLSILKSGLIIPRSGGSFQITGRMFGDGLYFSDQSTKSLNYSYGYWDGRTRDTNCFMFLADVAMGKHYTPPRPTGSLPSGYDSMYAQANKSGVMNNEMIVYRTSQADLRYLIEFDSK